MKLRGLVRDMSHGPQWRIETASASDPHLLGKHGTALEEVRGLFLVGKRYQKKAGAGATSFDATCWGNRIREPFHLAKVSA